MPGAPSPGGGHGEPRGSPRPSALRRTVGLARRTAWASRRCDGAVNRLGRREVSWDGRCVSGGSRAPRARAAAPSRCPRVRRPRSGVRSETTIPAAKASGTVHAAGWPSSAPATPVNGPAASTSDDRGQRRAPADPQRGEGAARGEARPPDAEHEQRAERRGRDGEGQGHGLREVGASGHQRQQERHDHGDDRAEAEAAYAVAQAAVVAQQVLRQHAGDRDARARSPWTGTPRTRPPRRGPTAPRPGHPSNTSGGQAQHDRVGLVGAGELGRVHPAERAEHRREHVEDAEQPEHGEGRAPRGAAVGVGVEAHEHVRQAHRAEEGREHDRVRRVERVLAPAVARQRRRPSRRR